MQYTHKERHKERALSPPIKPDKQSLECLSCAEFILTIHLDQFTVCLSDYRCCGSFKQLTDYTGFDFVGFCFYVTPFFIYIFLYLF